jgi:homoserine kinase
MVDDRPGASLGQDVEVAISVPATAANLGPGFDTFGLALDLRDGVRAIARPPRGRGRVTTRCVVDGVGRGMLPTGDDHLVASTLRSALTTLVPGIVQPDLTLECVNVIPHGRGLGSSAAAIVAGLGLAWELAASAGALGGVSPEDRLAWLVDRSSALEGHGDNAAAAVLGGAVVAWRDESGRHRAWPLAVDDGLDVVTAVPGHSFPTSAARAMLPETVPLQDAIFTAARTALLVEALRGERSLLLAATADRLHQDVRAAVMPQTIALVDRLRGAGHAAVVSGAGPAVLVLGASPAAVAEAAGGGWRVDRHVLGRGIHVETVVRAATDRRAARRP